MIYLLFISRLLWLVRGKGRDDEEYRERFCLRRGSRVT